ncbi:MAG: AI-2E family transporter [Elusimicrobiaceae bacterium]|nr:AI-2E family transporter [Elusimicrobiaceae bacterium]
MTKETASKFAPINTVCLMILAASAAMSVLVYTKTVLMPFVIALFISILANSLATWLKQKWKVNYLVGLVCSFLAFMAVLILAVSFISSSIESFVAGADIYKDRLNDSLDWILDKASNYHININAEFVNETLAKIPVFNMVKSVGSLIVSLFTNILLITLFVIFMFLGNASAEKPAFVGNVQKQISFYLLVKIGVSLLAALCTWIVLATTKTELAMMLAVLTFILNFIPNIGPVIATLSPVPVLFLQYGFDWHMLLVLTLLTAVHFVIGNILETRWLGQGMNLHPLVVIASLIFWALVWGVMGALLAVPLTAIIKMILEQHETTRPIARVLGGGFSIK